jgi:glycosyltransferase involved in cell wall biosynthesis
MKKRLLIFAHYFFPDVASTGQILTELCESLQNAFEITVIAVVPSYSGMIEDRYKGKRIYIEQHQNIKVIRVRVPEFSKENKASRIKNIISYFFNSIFAALKCSKQDIVYSISQPPILGGVLGVIGSRLKKAKFIYNIQDFNPEQTMAVGYSKNRLMLSLAMAIDKHSCRKADLVITVGRDMKETLFKRFISCKVPNNIVINNWIDEESIYPLPSDHPQVAEFKAKYDLKDKFIFMYSGNIGLYYDLENIIKVIGNFKNNKDVVFVFIGDGSVKKRLVDYCIEYELSNVSFIPYQEKEGLIYSLNAADVHIVTNAKGIKGISVPSKIYGVMAAGKMSLGILDKGSEARELIEASGGGICIEPGNYEEISNAISTILSSRESTKGIGLKAREYLIGNYKKTDSINKYINAIDKIR